MLALQDFAINMQNKTCLLLHFMTLYNLAKLTYKNG